MFRSRAWPSALPNAGAAGTSASVPYALPSNLNGPSENSPAPKFGFGASGPPGAWSTGSGWVGKSSTLSSV